MFTSQELFDLEMKHIFEGNWIYLAHESQIPRSTTTTPPRSAASRSSSPATRTISSTASSTPAPTAAPRWPRFKHGNKATYTCPFHGWTFNNSGKLLKIKDPEGTGYPATSTATAPTT
jgi:benzoate/toluate 1,2-dioxygenase alpha subunit